MKITKNIIIESIIIHLKEFFLLFFPKYCVSCNNALQKEEKILCTSCVYDIPRTNFHLKTDNPVSQLFWGITEIQYSTAFFTFEKGSKYRSLIHKLKYQNQPLIGYEMGKIFGSEICESVFSEVDVIIPVPLHPTKQFKRGYNQSETIAAGLAESMGKILDTKSLRRIKYTETQTKKSLEERRKNVAEVFKLFSGESLANKHILLVDDVITTGSTIHACAEALNKIPQVKISVACLAVAAH